MFINEYGDKSDPLVLLLAPMMVSGADLYQLMHPYFTVHHVWFDGVAFIRRQQDVLG